jgi:hypothetical protein
MNTEVLVEKAKIKFNIFDRHRPRNREKRTLELSVLDLKSREVLPSFGWVFNPFSTARILPEIPCFHNWHTGQIGNHKPMPHRELRQRMIGQSPLIFAFAKSPIFWKETLSKFNFFSRF